MTKFEQVAAMLMVPIYADKYTPKLAAQYAVEGANALFAELALEKIRYDRDEEPTDEPTDESLQEFIEDAMDILRKPSTKLRLVEELLELMDNQDYSNDY